MSTENKTVENKGQGADSEQKIEGTSNQNTQEVDYEAELARKDAEIAEIRKEKDNYKRGLLKAKGKLPEEEISSEEEEDLDEKIDRKVQERMLASREAQVQSEKEVLLAKQAKEIKELRLAVKNRAQINTTSGSGSNEDKPDVKTDKVLSQEQISFFKKQGKSDEWIENFKKNMNVGVSKSPLL